MARTFSLKTVQNLPVPLADAWEFFSRPDNLTRITPPGMGFRIRSHHHGGRMYPGQLIEYTVTPFPGMPFYWMTEITHVSEPNYFVDEQRYGPYALWHHQHHFCEVDGGVEMTDIVHYRMPLGFLGTMANALFVKEKLEAIFRHRYEVTTRLFGEWPGQQCDIRFFRS